jgi:hypothetical protein
MKYRIAKKIVNNSCRYNEHQINRAKLTLERRKRRAARKAED